MRETFRRTIAALITGSSLGFVPPTPLMAQEAGARKHVLVLHYYSDVLPLVRLVDQGVRTTLHHERYDYTIEHLDFTHFPDSDYRQTVADYLRRKYQHVRVDALVVVSDPMLAFLRDHPDLFPSVPVVAAVEQRDSPDAGAGRETVRMYSGEDIYGTAQLALTLHPGTEHLFVVGSSVHNNLPYEAEVKHQLEPIARSVDVTFLNNLSQDQMADRLRTLPRQSAVIYLRYFRDLVPRQTYSDVFERLAQAANAPVYGVYDVQIGRGAVGGYMLDSEGLGKRAAEAAIDLANGRRTPNMGDLRAPRVPTFDGRQLRRWGISESQLPAGHVVQFRQVTLWEQYRGYIVGAISLVAIQMMLIAGLLVQRARRQRSEDALRHSEARNRAMLWALPDLMFVQNSDGVYLDYHAKDLRELLLPPEQFLGKNMKEVLPPELAAKFGRCLTDVTESRELRSQEYSLTIGGEVKHYEARIVPHDGDKVLSIIRDITEQQRALDALRQSEERFSKVFMASPLPMALTTIEDGRYLAVNESFLTMSGYARDEVVGHTATELGNWCSQEAREEFVRVLQDQGSVRNYETCFGAKSANRVLLLSGELIELDGRRCILAASSDITERKRSEEALDQARQELARVSRLSAMGELAAAITHEVNQPLSAVIANAATCVEWLNQGGIDKEEFVEALHDILSDAERASAVVQRTREAFKHVRIRQMDLDLNDLIRGVLALARTRLERATVVVKTHLAPGLPLVRGDRVEMQQVVLNLVMNAVDAMEAVHGRRRTLAISTRLDSGQGVAVTVRDSGSGVSASQAERIFDTLYTTKDDGMGMGLAVSRSIVEAHGGRLRSIPVDGVGAVFEFVLPGNGRHARA